MTSESNGARAGGLGSLVAELPTDRLREEAQNLLSALGERALASVGDKVSGATERLVGYAENGGGPGLMAALTGASGLLEGKSPLRAALGAGMTGLKETVKGALTGKKGGARSRQKLKLTNIVEQIDVGVPVTVAYNQWTQYEEFPTFMKKVESVRRDSDTDSHWKAQVFWSHREWKAHVLEQVPDERIVWRSEAAKGRVDGAVTFHEVAPELTRILLVLEYHPQGVFERTGNLWRAQGRRARLELKHFRRHVMTHTALHPDEVEGWRGVVHDGEVVEDHQPAGGEEAEEREPEAHEEEGEAREERERPGEGEEGRAEDEEEYEEEDEEPEEEEDEEEEDEEEPEGEYDQDEYEEEDEYEEPLSRSRRR